MANLSAVHDAEIAFALRGESAATDLHGIGDGCPGRNGEDKFVFADAADERPALLHARWKTLRYFRRNGALCIQFKPYAGIDAAEVLQRIEKAATRISGEKRISRNGVTKRRFRN